MLGLVVVGAGLALLLSVALGGWLGGRGLPFLSLPFVATMWLLLLAIVPQLLGHSTFNWALRYFPASLVSITLLGEPIGSTILAYILLKESPTPLKIAGAVLILAMIYIFLHISSSLRILNVIVSFLV